MAQFRDRESLLTQAATSTTSSSVAETQRDDTCGLCGRAVYVSKQQRRDYVDSASNTSACMSTNQWHFAQIPGSLDGPFVVLQSSGSFGNTTARSLRTLSRHSGQLCPPCHFSIYHTQIIPSWSPRPLTSSWICLCLLWFFCHSCGNRSVGRGLCALALRVFVGKEHGPCNDQATARGRFERRTGKLTSHDGRNQCWYE